MARQRKSTRPNPGIVHAEETHIFPRPASGYERQAYARELTRRRLARSAGLPEVRTIANGLRGLGDPQLPIAKKRDELILTVHKNQVTILEGETGSGKTTQPWQYLLGEGYERIFVLVPRILIAENVYARAIDELSNQRTPQLAEELLGISHGDRSHRKDTNKVVFMTAGTYLRTFPEVRANYKDRPFVVIADEIHEGDVEVERAVAVTASMLTEMPSARLILSSATQDKDRIRQTMDSVNGRKTPTVHVDGRPFDLTIIEEPELTPAEAYVKYGWSTDIEDGARKALTFAPGKAEISGRIDNAIKALDENLKGSSERVRFYPLHAKLTSAAIANIYLDPQEDERMLIVSSSAGQSGITISGVPLVIADGLARRPELDEEGTPGLMTRYASQAEIIQQLGRAGRDVDGGIGILTKPGEESEGDFTFVPLVDREPFAPAQIYSMNISRLVLNTTAIGFDPIDVNRFMMNDVSEATIVAAQESLYRLGALDEQNNVTSIGKKMDIFPVRPELSRGIVEAWIRGYPIENIAQITAIAAALEVGGLAYYAKDAGTGWKQYVREGADNDYVAQLDLFLATRGMYVRPGDTEVRLSEEGFDAKNVIRAHKQWDKMMRALGYNPYDIHMRAASDADKRAIVTAMLAGLVDNIYEKVGSEDRGRTSLYRNIFREGTAGAQRKISSRSVIAAGCSSQFVVGWPRRFEVFRDGQQEIVHILEHVIEGIDPADAVGYAEHLIVERPLEPKLDSSGRLQQRVEKRLGRIRVGRETTPSEQMPTAEGAELLFAGAKEHPGEVQNSLRRIVHELSDLSHLIPPDEVPYTFAEYPLLSSADIDAQIHRLSRESRSLGQIDEGLRAWLYEEGLSVEKYAPSHVVASIKQRSPRKFALTDGRDVKLYYHRGKPIVRNFILDDTVFIPSGCRLTDGREVFFQHIGGDKSSKLWAYSDLKVMKGIED